MNHEESDRAIDQVLQMEESGQEISKTTNQIENGTSSNIKDNDTLEDEILNYVSHSKAIFKSQERGDPELSFEEKKSIASKLLCKSHCLFLSKFGHFLKKEHLTFFEENQDKGYETIYHINRLKRYHDNASRQIDVKNRRYQALKQMVEKGEYFSETEMMKRNPLLYDQLIGRYLTNAQKKARDNLDTTNITFVNLLLESIERDRLRNLKKAQEEAEDDVKEEIESDEDSDEKCRGKEEVATKPQWGEISMTKSPYEKQERENRENVFENKIPSKERQILREEFVTHMYQNFLNGKDAEFDYSTVDDNEAYDNVELRTQDEEEKYFDSESPEVVLSNNKIELNESEDELDLYMKSLQEVSSSKSLTKDVKK